MYIPYGAERGGARTGTWRENKIYPVVIFLDKNCKLFSASHWDALKKSKCRKYIFGSFFFNIFFITIFSFDSSKYIELSMRLSTYQESLSDPKSDNICLLKIAVQNHPKPAKIDFFAYFRWFWTAILSR